MTRNHRHNPRRRVPRAFTLLEVVLACVLGTIIIGAAAGVFATIEVEKARQAARLETNLEFGTAHRTLTSVFSGLLMVDGAPPDNEQTKERIENDIRSAYGEDAYVVTRPDDDSIRLSLQPDPLITDDRGVPAQTFEVTLRAAPIRGLDALNPATAEDTAEMREIAWYRSSAQAALRDRLAGRTRAADAAEQSAATAAGGALSAASARLPGGNRATAADAAAPARTAAGAAALRSASLADKLPGLGAAVDAAALDAAAGRIAGAADEPPRAIGLRGVLELRADDDAQTLQRARLANSAAPPLALWWRELPTDADVMIDDPDAARDAAMIQFARGASAVREHKLLSGLKSAQWQAYRRRQWVHKMNAAWAGELPAYVNLKFETLEGRVEDWLFEINWSYGAEPGSIVNTNDPFNNAPANPALNPTTGGAEGGGGGGDQGGGNDGSGGANPGQVGGGGAGGSNPGKSVSGPGRGGGAIGKTPGRGAGKGGGRGTKEGGPPDRSRRESERDAERRATER